jgi:phasin family protein
MFDMSNYDMSKIFDVSKITGDWKMPQMPQMTQMPQMQMCDGEAILALQRKNIEAFTALSQATMETMQALWRRQADSCRQIMGEITQMSQTVMACPTPEAKAMKQAEVSKAAMERYISNLRDASETVAKCNTQAMETVGARLNETLNEMCGMVKNASSRAA